MIAKNLTHTSSINVTEQVANVTNLSQITIMEETGFAYFTEKVYLSSLFIVLYIIGNFGNINTFLVYSCSSDMKKRCVRVLVLWLSVVDLFVCVVVVPFEIAEILLRYTVFSNWACKLLRYLNHTSAALSALLITLTALERHQKTYAGVPNYNSRLTSLLNAIYPEILKVKSKEFQCNLICVVVTFISFAFVSPILVVVGIEEFPSNFTVKFTKICTTLSQYKSLTHAGVYVIIFAGTLCFLICLYSYGKIFQLMSRQRKQKMKMNSGMKSIEISVNKDNQSVQGQHCHKNRTKLKDEKHMIDDKSVSRDRYEESVRQLTISLAIATCVSFLGYLIFMIFAGITALNPEYESRTWRSAAVLLRAFFNNAANPITYFIFDRKFRIAVKKLYNCKKRKTELSSNP